MQSRTFSTRIRVLVPRLDSRSCLVSFAHALFKGLAETLQSASFRMYSECIHFTICLQRKMKKSTLSTALSTAFSAFSHALLALGTSFRSPAAWLKGWSNCWNTFQDANRIQMVFLRTWTDLASFLGHAFQSIWPEEEDCCAQDLSKLAQVFTKFYQRKK